MNANRLTVVILALAVISQAFLLHKRQAAPQLPRSVTVPAGEVALDLADLQEAPGSQAAELAVIEFSDYECPYCRLHASQTLPTIRDKYVVTGEIRYAFANFPLDSHSNARFLAAAAICAGRQGKYWDMHDAIFSEITPEAGATMSEAEAIQLASTMEVDELTYSECLAADDVAAAIDRDLGKARELLLSYTPSFAVGHVDANGQVQVERIIAGAQPLAVFEEVFGSL